MSSGVAAIRRAPWNISVTIANGESTSGVIDIEGASFGGIFALASFDGSAITWEAAYTAKGADINDDSTLTWYDCVDDSGSAVSTDISAGEYAALDSSLFGARYLRATSGTSQTGAGELRIVLKG